MKLTLPIHSSIEIKLKKLILLMKTINHVVDLKSQYLIYKVYNDRHVYFNLSL